MKLQILVPQYKETDEIIKPLLDSIEIQQNVDLKNEVGVIIVNDGSNVHLSRELLDRYSYRIDYYTNEKKNKGISATRNACLDYATAEYVMFCDADDMFYHICGLYVIFREINKGGFDTFVSDFIEEQREKRTNKPRYVMHNRDCTFVHGKVHRRQYLLDNNIRWNEKLTLHEDGYFNTLCLVMTENIVFFPTPFYLWKWRANSIVRSDANWVMNTYEHCIKCNDALIDELLKRGKKADAQNCATAALLNTYLMMNRPEWAHQKDKEHKILTEQRIREFYLKFKDLYKTISSTAKNQIVEDISNKMQSNSREMLIVKFESWLKRMEVNDSNDNE